MGKKTVIGIITAMEEEKKEIQKIMRDVVTEEVYDLRFKKGKINNQQCILVKCGIGKVNAARATQILIDKYKVDAVMNLGSGGSVNTFLNIGDVVIGKEVVQHDFDITAFGHSKGYITGVGDRVICDRDLVSLFEKTINNMNDRTYNIKLGIVATGDIFCTQPEMKDKIRAKFNADVVDMECGAMAQVCYLDKVPFIVVRSISDTPNRKNATIFEENLKLASQRCAEILNEFFR
ncbi:MAG: 5'-methylthioadenosine/adenosylhomocysteine nucleosidase [Clostridia bacterium]|nr:5'-methylthioadenosine/adenosylhomocysteine nucleosidase [Clostridia bacterium]